MPRIRCSKCNREIEVPFNWDRNATCNYCGGYFIGVNPLPLNSYQNQRYYGNIPKNQNFTPQPPKNANLGHFLSRIKITKETLLYLGIGIGIGIIAFKLLF